MSGREDRAWQHGFDMTGLFCCFFVYYWTCKGVRCGMVWIYSAELHLRRVSELNYATEKFNIFLLEFRMM